jgi:hypothetical protein
VKGQEKPRSLPVILDSGPDSSQGNPWCEPQQCKCTSLSQMYATHIRFTGAAGFSTQLAHRPLLLARLLEALAACLMYDRAAAPLALHMRVADGGGVHQQRQAHTHPTSQPGATSSATAAGGGGGGNSGGGVKHSAGTASQGASGMGAGASAGGCAASLEASCGAAAHVSSAARGAYAAGSPPPSISSTVSSFPDAMPSCVLLPRMPLCTLHLGSVRCYEAVAGVARSLGHVARLADVMAVSGGADIVQAFFDCFIAIYHGSLRL